MYCRGAVEVLALGGLGLGIGLGTGPSVLASWCGAAGTAHGTSNDSRASPRVKVGLGLGDERSAKPSSLRTRLGLG